MSKSTEQSTDAAEAPAAPRRPRLLPIIGQIVAGMKVAWPIFEDVHPAEVLTEPYAGLDDRGRSGTIVELLVERTNLQGGRFTKKQKVLEQFVFQAPEGLEAEMLTGDIDEDLANHAMRVEDYLAERGTQASAYTE